MFFIQDNGNVLLWFFAKRSPLKSKDIPIFGSEGYNHTRMVTHQRWELIGNIPISKFKKFWTEIYIVPRASRKHSFQQKFDRMFFIHLTELLQSIKCFEYRFLELKVWFWCFVCTFVWCTITTLFVSLHHIFLMKIRGLHTPQVWIQLYHENSCDIYRTNHSLLYKRNLWPSYGSFGNLHKTDKRSSTRSHPSLCSS